MQNWARNITYKAGRVHFPTTVAEAQALVRSCERAHGLGTRHSFSHLPDSEGGDLISLKNLNRVVGLNHDSDRPSVTVEAGITYSQLCTFLDGTGFALRNLASLPHISVAGACETATHGSGSRNRSLSSAVRAIKRIGDDGEIETITRDDPDFCGKIVGLGGLGLTIELTLELVSVFGIEQRVYERLDFTKVTPQVFDDITGTAYSVSLFTDWQDRRFNQVWFKSRPGESHYPLQQLRATAATENRHPAQGACAESALKDLINPKKCTEQLGVPGPWHARLPHFRMELEPSSSGEELQSEYMIPREHAVAAMTRLFDMSEALRPLIEISEIRTIDQDDLWMSPFYRRPTAAIHFTWRKLPDRVEAILPQIEETLEPFKPRPHWGKLFAMDPATLRSRYREKVSDFRRLLDEHPSFSNAFLSGHL